MNTKKFFGVVVSVMFTSTLVSVSEPVIMQLMHTKSQFDYYVENYPVVVAFCYALPEHNKQKEQEIRRVYSILQHAMRSHEDEYKTAHVKFIAVNRAVGDLVSLTKEYGFDTNDAYLIFFNYGKAVSMKKLPQAIPAQTINAFIAARQLEKTEEPKETQVIAPRAVPHVLPYYNDETDDQDADDAVCKKCFESETDLEYCENRLCAKCARCKYKRPHSMYDGWPEFSTGPDHLYGIPFNYNYGNYWGGTITNPIN